MKVVLDEGAIMPTRAHPWDAGLDLYAPAETIVPPVGAEIINGCLYASYTVGSATIDTGVHVEIPEGYVGLILPKSGLNVNNGLTCDGVIDAHYTGSIKVKLYNNSEKAHYFQAGDKIAQLVILPCLLPDLELADMLEETDRGDNGFGSTGR